MTGEAPRLTATGSQTVGPFFLFGLASDASLGCLVRPETTGERIRLLVRVVDGNGQPVPDALVEVLQADADGRYVQPGAGGIGVAGADFAGFGRLPTIADGTCVFETIRPGRVPDNRGGLQAPHINVCLFARGLLRQLYTRIYFDGDAGLREDALLSLVPEDRRQTLLAQPTGEAPGQWTFEIRLQGDRETVFFDL
jgi:protocatechuate 3,4-dioxygenase, alpha subunit